MVTIIMILVGIFLLGPLFGTIAGLGTAYLTGYLQLPFGKAGPSAAEQKQNRYA